MKSSRSREPRRWRDLGADGAAPESRAALRAEAAVEVTPLGLQALARIRARIVARRSARAFLGFHAAPVRTRLAVALGLILFCAATAGGASVLWRKYFSAARRQTNPPAEPPPPPTPHSISRSTPGAQASEAPWSHEPRIAMDDDVVPTRRLATVARPSLPTSPVAPPTSAEGPAAAQPDRLTEARLVGEALAHLRQRNDPRAALSTLDRYSREFPHGVLETEALRTRVEAFIRLDDRKASLALLDGQRAPADSLGAELLLTRAELRASAGRFREALADFTGVLELADGALATGGDERALYGRAVCLGRLSQDERARVDLLTYQRRFPGGKFAVEVQRLLTGSSPPPHP